MISPLVQIWLSYLDEDRSEQSFTRRCFEQIFITLDIQKKYLLQSNNNLKSLKIGEGEVNFFKTRYAVCKINRCKSRLQADGARNLKLEVRLSIKYLSRISTFQHNLFADSDFMQFSHSISQASEPKIESILCNGKTYSLTPEQILSELISFSSYHDTIQTEKLCQKINFLHFIMIQVKI